jgi:signal peptidase I
VDVTVGGFPTGSGRQRAGADQPGARLSADMTSSTNDASAGAPPDARGPRKSQWLRELVVVVLVAVGVAVLLRTFVVQTFSIPSGSMMPTLDIGDRIVVDKLAYDLHGVGRGDIVVFSRPPAENCAGPPVADLVKRVIGLPGETISLSGHGYVLINGKRLNETWLPKAVQGTTYPGPTGHPYSLDHPYKIPSGDYFMMGDNRGDSCDSRFWGPISKSLIVGKVDVRLWPLTRFHFF